MGDMADWDIEQGMDAYAKHIAGMCDDTCEYCEIEYQKQLQQEKKDARRIKGNSAD